LPLGERFSTSLEAAGISLEAAELTGCGTARFVGWVRFGPAMIESGRLRKSFGRFEANLPYKNRMGANKKVENEAAYLVCGKEIGKWSKPIWPLTRPFGAPSPGGRGGTLTQWE